MARLALSFGGALIGNAIGGSTGARIGWALGSVAGSIIFAEDTNTQGPRLGDLKVTSSAYGNPIPTVYGTYRIAGNIIWSAGIKETSNTQDVGGGKGGGGSQTHTSYTYSCSFAVGLCTGEIAGIRKIWADSILIYDKGSTATADELAASNQAGITVFTGSELQSPSSTIEAIEGVGNVPAFRGMAYILFDDFQLEKYGNRIPNITCEVVEVGINNEIKTVDFVSSIVTSGGPHTTCLYSDSEKMVVVATEWDSFNGLSGDCQIYVLDTQENVLVGEFVPSVHTAVIPQGSSDTPGFATQAATFSPSLIFYHINENDGSVSQLVYITLVGGSIANFNNFGSIVKQGNSIFLYRYNGAIWKADAYVSGTGVVVYNDATSGFAAPLHCIAASPSYVYGLFTDNTLVKWDHNFNFISSTLVDFITPPNYTHFGGTETELYCEDDNTVWVYSFLWIQKVVSGVYESYRTVESPGYEMFGGWNIDKNIMTSYSATWNLVRQWELNLLNPQTRQLSGVIADLCNEAGVSSDNIDVSTLSTEIKGYTRTSPMSARAGLEPLLNAYNLTAVESDYKLKFEVKQGTYDKLLLDTDLAATVAEIPTADRLTISRVQDTDIPRRVTVSYSEEARNYEPGIQYAQRIKT